MQGGTDASEETWWVVCLCAQWCGVCRDWQPLFELQARAHPALRFAWVDIEDEADAVGDFDIDTFPTLLIAHGARPLFLGPVPALASQLGRLLATLQAQQQPASGLPPEAAALLQRLATRVLPRVAL